MRVEFIERWKGVFFSFLGQRAVGEFAPNLVFIFLLAILYISLPAVAIGQANSGVTGVVTDVNGALVPGVEVKLTDTKTSRELTTVTNDQGVYTFRNVPQGTGYTLVFTAAGFQRYILNDVQLGI